MELGLTQRELGRALGRPQSYVAKIELGERRLDVLDMAAFAQAFGLQPAELASRLRLIELGNAVSCDGGR